MPPTAAPGRLPVTLPALALAGLLLLGACSSASVVASNSPGPSTSASTVTMSGLSFGVAEITVSAGDVSFVNADSVPHLVAEGQNGLEVAQPRFAKASIAGGATQAISFSAPGDYNITCTIHHQMNMVIHVQ